MHLLHRYEKQKCDFRLWDQGSKIDRVAHYRVHNFCQGKTSLIELVPVKFYGQATAFNATRTMLSTYICRQWKRSMTASLLVRQMARFFEHSKALGNSTKKTFNWNLKFSVSVKRVKEQEQALGNWSKSRSDIAPYFNCLFTLGKYDGNVSQSVISNRKNIRKYRIA